MAAYAIIVDISRITRFRSILKRRPCRQVPIPSYQIGQDGDCGTRSCGGDPHVIHECLDYNAARKSLNFW